MSNAKPTTKNPKDAPAKPAPQKDEFPMGQWRAEKFDVRVAPAPKTMLASLSDRGPVDLMRTEGGGRGLLIYRETDGIVLVNLQDGSGFKLSPGAAAVLGEYLSSYSASAAATKWALAT